MSVLTGDATAQRRAIWHDDEVAAMVWRRRGHTRTWVDGRLRHDPSVAAWIENAVRQGTAFSIIYLADIGAVPSG